MRSASTRSARVGEANGDGGYGGDAAEWADDATAGLGSSGKDLRVLRCTNSTTNDPNV
jgi:hypothetical protein